MAYITETVSSMADFITKLDTFLTGTAGWTSDVLNTGTGRWAVHKSTVRVAAQWDTTNPNSLGWYQYINASYNTGVAPYQQTNDSGQGAASTSEASLNTNRRVTVGNTPVKYWCFADDNDAHVVVQTNSTPTLLHFGMGELDKVGNWTGGEYSYAQRNSTNTSSGPAIQVGTSCLLDGLAANGSSPNLTTGMEQYVATIHCESLPAQVSGGLWAVVMGNQPSGSLGNDRQASPKARAHFIGGFRGGLLARPLGRFSGSSIKGYAPAYPIEASYWDRTNDRLYGFMGYMKNVRGFVVANYVAGDEITIGSDTWIAFPTNVRWTGSGTTQNTTAYQGILYKKIP